jgi:hypothetical protein
LFFLDEVEAKSARIRDNLLFFLCMHGKTAPWARGQIRLQTADYSCCGLDFKPLDFFPLETEFF